MIVDEQGKIFSPRVITPTNEVIATRHAPSRSTKADRSHWALRERDDILELLARALRVAEIMTRADQAVIKFLLRNTGWKSALRFPPGANPISR